MKEFEDKAWKDMQRRLDVALPGKKYGAALWKRFLPLLLLVGAIIPVAYSLWTHADNGSALQPHRIERQPVKSHPALADQVTDHAAENRGTTVPVAIASAGEVPIQASAVAENLTKRSTGRLSGQAGIPTTGVTLSVNDNIGRMETAVSGPADITRKEAEESVDQNIVTTIDKLSSDDPDVGSISLQQRNAPADIRELSPIATKNLQSLGVDTYQTGYTAFPVKATVNLFGFSVKLNTYSEVKDRYKGASLAPEIQLNIGKNSSFFLSVPVRYRYSNDKIISEEFNNELSKVFDRNNFFTPGEILADEEKVNAHTFDAGLDLGFRQRLGRKVDIGVSGIARYDNIFGLAQVPASVSEFSSATNSAYEDANRNFESKKDGWSFGTGLDAKFRMTPRHSVFAGFSYLFNKSDKMEISMGYAFRLF